MTLAALTAAVSVVSNVKNSTDDSSPANPGSALGSQRIVVFGAGSAGLGIARQLRDAMLLSPDVKNEQANKHIWLIDRFGLVVRSFGNDKIRPGTEEFARDDKDWASTPDSNGGSERVDISDATKNEHGSYTLKTVIQKVRPTILIGTSTVPGAFTEEVIREMAKHVDRPIIFPLSNPTRLVEAKPKDIMQWTNGKALIATGSPFAAVDLGDGKSYE